MSPGKRGEWLSILLVLDSKRSRGLYQRLISPDMRHIYTLSIEEWIGCRGNYNNEEVEFCNIIISFK